MPGAADLLGLGVLLSWKDKATAQIKKTEHAVDNLGESVDETTERTARMQSQFASLGKVGAGITAFGIAGAGALFMTARAAGTFEDTLRDTMTMTGLTGKAFEQMEMQLGDTALAMSTKFGMSAADINKSFYQVLSAGAAAGTKDFRALSESALMMGKVVGMEPAAAVEYLSDSLHSFEMQVSDAERMADVFFKTSMLGATTVPQMADAMKEASKVAVEMKIPLADVAAVLTGFAGKGIKGAEAGTAFRQIMTKLAAPSKEAADALAKLGVQVYDSTTQEMRPLLSVLGDMQRGFAGVTHQEREALLKAVAGEEAFSKLGGILASDLSILSSWSKELEKGGVLQTAFKQKTQTLNFAFAAMREALRNVFIILGQHLLPVITPVLGKIGKLAGGIGDFLKAYPGLAKTAVVFGAIATAVALVGGPLLTVVGVIGAMGGIPAILAMVSAGFASLTAAAGALGGVMAAAFWPVTAVVAAVALLYLAFKHNFLGIGTIVKAIGKVTWGFFKGIWKGIKAGLNPLIDAFKQTWSAIKEVFAPLGQAGKYIGKLMGRSKKGAKTANFLGKAMQFVGKVIGYALVLPLKMVLTPITWVTRGISWLIVKTRDLTSWLGGKLAPHFGIVKKAMLYMLGPIGIVIAHFGKIKSTVFSVIEWIGTNWDLLGDIMLWPINTIYQGWVKLKEGMVSLFTSLGETVSGIFNSIKDAIVGVLDWIWNKITWVIAKIPDALLPESLEKIKRQATASGGRRKKGGVSAGIGYGGASVGLAAARAGRKSVGMQPRIAMAGAGGGSYDQSVNIQPGAIVLNASRIDEHSAQKIDRELAKLIERRRERR